VGGKRRLVFYLVEEAGNCSGPFFPTAGSPPWCHHAPHPVLRPLQGMKPGPTDATASCNHSRPPPLPCWSRGPTPASRPPTRSYSAPPNSAAATSARNSPPPLRKPVWTTGKKGLRRRQRRLPRLPPGRPLHRATRPPGLHCQRHPGAPPLFLSLLLLPPRPLPRRRGPGPGWPLEPVAAAGGDLAGRLGPVRPG
jgi:hypothetical protein